MSELSIVIPLSMLPPDFPLETTELLAALTESGKLRQDVEQFKSRYNALVREWNTAGNSLELILDEVEGFEKARALRAFVQTLKDKRMLEVT